MSPSVRLATVEDAEPLARLLHDFNTEFDTPSPGPEVLAPRLRHHLAGDGMFAILADPPGFALVSVRPNVWYEGPVALLDELYVAPAHRNGGTGSAIIDLLVRTARARRCGAIEINIDEADVDAMRFYERHGFSGLVPDTGERAFYYSMELD